MSKPRLNQPIARTPYGYGAVSDDLASLRGDVTTEDYAAAQEESKKRSFILPLLAEKPAKRVLDVERGGI